MEVSLSTDRFLISIPEARSSNVECVVSNPEREVVVMSKFKRLVIFAVAALSLATAAGPAYAGEDGCDDDECRRASSGGGSDTGSASGGAQTGLGGMAVDNQDATTTVIGLAGGGLLVLTAAGLVARRREIEVGV